MNIEEAILKLDEPVGKDDYSKLFAYSKSLGKHLIKSKYGLCICTCDWPAPYSLQKKDFETTDWEITKNI